jgi:hypothetical protein
MPPRPPACPLDDSPLCRLGGRSGPEAEYQYCPRCDVGFVVLPGRPSQIFVWRRRKKELTFDDRAASGRELPDRKLHESALRKAVAAFLEARFGSTAFCPRDGGRIPLISQANPLRFSWCRSCRLGFVESRDPDYGWEWAATFTSKNLKPFVVVDVRDRDVDVGPIETHLQSLNPRKVLP